MNGKRQRPVRNKRVNDTNNAGLKRRRRTRAVVLSALAVAIFLMLGVYVVVMANEEGETSDSLISSIHKCPEATAPYVNRRGVKALTPDDQNIFIYNGIFGDGSGSVGPTAPNIPICDEGDGEILLRVFNLDVDIQITDEQGKVIGHESLHMYNGLVGGFVPPNPQELLSGKQQNLPEPTPTLQTHE